MGSGKISTGRKVYVGTGDTIIIRTGFRPVIFVEYQEPDGSLTWLGNLQILTGYGGVIFVEAPPEEDE